MNCFETLKISQQYSKIIQKIQQRTDKDTKGKKTSQFLNANSSKQNVTGSKQQSTAATPSSQNNRNQYVGISPNISSTQRQNHTKNNPYFTDKSPVSTTPRQHYTPLTPLKNLLGNHQSLSPISANMNPMRNASKTIHYPPNTMQNNNNNNISNLILNTTNMLEDNSFVSINNHTSMNQQEHKPNTYRPFFNDISSTNLKTPTSKSQNNPSDTNILNNHTPKRLFFQNNCRNNDISQQQLTARNAQAIAKSTKDQQNLKCSQCKQKKAKYQRRNATKTGESVLFFCSKCAITLVEQGQKLECIPYMNTPISSSKNSVIIPTVKQIEEEEQVQQQSYVPISPSRVNILSNLQIPNNMNNIINSQINNKNILQGEIQQNTCLLQSKQDSSKKISSNQKENIFITPIGFESNQSTQNTYHQEFKKPEIIGNANNQQQTKQQNSIPIHSNKEENNHQNIQMQQYSTQNQDEQQDYQQTNQDQNQKNQQVIQIWNYLESENQEEQDWQDLGPKLTFEGDSKRPSDQDKFPQQKHIQNAKMVVFTNQDEKQLTESKKEEQESMNGKESGILSPILNYNQANFSHSNNIFFGRDSSNQNENNMSNTEIIQNVTNFNNVSQPNDDADKFESQEQQDLVDNEDDNQQYLPQFIDQSKYNDECRERKAEILHNFMQELNINNTRVNSCLNQLVQRKKEVTKFYENQELKLQQNAQSLIQLIQTELIDSVERLRSAQANTLGLFSEKENRLQKIYFEIQSTEQDVQKNKNQIIECMEEIPFNNIIQLYNQNLSKNASAINELPNQVLNLSKTYYLSEKKQASTQLLQGLKDILLVQEKRTTLFGNSSYASATSTPQASNTNNNSYSIISPRGKNNLSSSSNNIFGMNNQNSNQYQQQINNYHAQPRNLSQTTSMTSSRTYTSFSNSNNNNNNHPPTQTAQNFTKQANQKNSSTIVPSNNNVTPTKNKLNQGQLSEEYGMQQQYPFTRNEFGNNPEQLQQAQKLQELQNDQIFAAMSQQNSACNPKQSLQDSFSGNHSDIHRPIVSNSISSPLIKKNNLFLNHDNPSLQNGNYPPHNPYMSVENHIEQIYKHDFTREDAPSYSSVQFQRWKECERTIVEQLMSIEQNDVNLTPSGSKQDIDFTSPVQYQQSSTVQGIVPQNLFQVDSSLQTFQVMNTTDIQQRNDKKLESISEKVDTSAQDANSSYQMNHQSKASFDGISPCTEKEIPAPPTVVEQQNNEVIESKKSPNKFEDLKSNYQWMIEQFKQNLISQPTLNGISGIESKKQKNTSNLFSGQIINETISIGGKNNDQEENQNQVQNIEENQNLKQKREGLQDITTTTNYYDDQSNNQHNQDFTGVNGAQKNITQMKEQNTNLFQQPNSSINMRDISSNENSIIGQSQLKSYNQEANTEGFNLTYSASVLAGFNSMNDPTMQNNYSHAGQSKRASIQNQDIAQRNQIVKQEESHYFNNNLISVNQQNNSQSNIFPYLESKVNDQLEEDKTLSQSTKSYNQGLNQERESSHNTNNYDNTNLSQEKNYINNINFVNSFSQNVQISDAFLERSIVQNYINKESFSESNTHMFQQDDSNQYSLKSHQQNLLSETYSCQNDQQHSDNPVAKNQINNGVIGEGAFSAQSTKFQPNFNYNYNDHVIEFSLNNQQLGENKITTNRAAIIGKDSFSDATYTIQQDSIEEDQHIKTNSQELILDLNQLHDISGEEDDINSGQNSCKRPLKYSEIIQRIHENYNRLSQNCQKRPSQTSKSQQQQQTDQADQFVEQTNTRIGVEESFAGQSEIIATEESQQLFTNQEQMHFEITNNLTDLQSNRHNEHFNSFSSSNLMQSEQSPRKMKLEKSENMESSNTNQNNVSSHIEEQINNHIIKQISQQRGSSLNKYSELIKSSPHFKNQNLLDEDSALSPNYEQEHEGENEIRSTPFQESLQKSRESI